MNLHLAGNIIFEHFFFFPECHALATSQQGNMAASVTMSVRKCLRSVVTFSKQLRQSEYCYAHPNTIMRRISSGQSYSRFPRLLRARSVKGVVGAVSVTAGVAGCVTLAVGHSKVVQADSGKRPTRAKYPVARKVYRPLTQKCMLLLPAS